MAASSAEVPKPAQLYNLIVLALLMHKSATSGACRGCGQSWPCPQVRLAYRLREGF